MDAFIKSNPAKWWEETAPISIIAPSGREAEQRHGSVSGSHRGDQRFRLNEANFFALERSRKTSLTIPASGFIEARLVVLFHSGRYLIANPGAGWPAHDLVVVVSITEPQ